MITLSKNAMHVLCLKLGLNCGTASTEYNGLTILSVEVVHKYINTKKDKIINLQVKGIHSMQDKTNTSKLNHVQFDVTI